MRRWSQMSKQVRWNSPLDASNQLLLGDSFSNHVFRHCRAKRARYSHNCVLSLRRRFHMTQPAKFTFALGLQEMSRSLYKFKHIGGRSVFETLSPARRCRVAISGDSRDTINALASRRHAPCRSLPAVQVNTRSVSLEVCRGRGHRRLTLVG